MLLQSKVRGGEGPHVELQRLLQSKVRRGEGGSSCRAAHAPTEQGGEGRVMVICIVQQEYCESAVIIVQCVDDIGPCYKQGALFSMCVNICPSWEPAINERVARRTQQGSH